MAHNDIEIEIKLPLKNPEQVIQFLNEHAKLLSKDVFQKDTYFNSVHRNFLKFQYPFEWLRIRETTKSSSLNYKHFYPENVEKTDYCDEFETEIENPESMRKILNSLDVKEIIIVEKKRTTYLYEQVEIMIDEVNNLGVYIELETTTPFDNPQAAKQYLFSILEKIQAEVGEEELIGYPYMLLHKKD